MRLIDDLEFLFFEELRLFFLFRFRLLILDVLRLFVFAIEVEERFLLIGAIEF